MERRPKIIEQSRTLRLSECQPEMLVEDALESSVYNGGLQHLRRLPITQTPPEHLVVR